MAKILGNRSLFPRCLGLVLIGTMLLPTIGFAQGRSPERSGGSTGPQVERGAGGPETERGPKADRGRQDGVVRDPAETRRRDSEQTRRERPGKAPDSSAAPPETGGFLGSLRRFFGFGRSQERMSEQGRENERATEQNRASNPRQNGEQPDDGDSDD